MLNCLTVSVDSLKPFFRRIGTQPAPLPVSDAGQEGEQKVELLLNRQVVCCMVHYLARWPGHTSAEE